MPEFALNVLVRPTSGETPVGTAKHAKQNRRA